MAALRAKTMHASMSANDSQLKEYEVVLSAKKKPMQAKGNAKIVCAKSTNETYFLIKRRLDSVR